MSHKRCHTLVATIAALLCLTACSGLVIGIDSYDDLILGNWEMTECYYVYADSTREDVAPDDLMYTYFRDKTIVTVDPDGNQYRGTYRISGDDLFVTIGDETILYTIEKLSLNTMVLVYVSGDLDYDEGAYTQTLKFERI